MFWRRRTGDYKAGPPAVSSAPRYLVPFGASFPGSKMPWLQSGGCIYSCRHPLWSGQGICQAHKDDASKYECLCDPGYISTDSLGNPSCVPTSVLIWGYFTIAVAEALALAFLVRSWRRQLRLPMMLRITRRASIRRRLIASVGFWCGTSSIVFGIAAGHARTRTLYSCGMLQVLYAFCMPPLILAVGSVMELWVDSLPSQMMPTGGITLRMKVVVEKQNLFRYIGCLAMTAVGAIGVFTYFFLDALYTSRIINIVIAGSAGCGILCVNTVGVMVTLLINRATQTASPSAKIFYAQSTKTLWRKVVVLSATAASWITAVAVQELTQAGRGTPILIIVGLMSSSTVGLTVSVHFSEWKPLRLMLAQRATPAKGFLWKRSAPAPPGVDGPLYREEENETQEDKSRSLESFPVTLWFTNAARRLSWKGSTSIRHPHAVVPMADLDL